MRINFGCGTRVWKGYVNIDAVHRPEANANPEIIFAFEFDSEGELVERIPIDDGVAEELNAIHVFEHFHRWECDAVIKEWKRVLKPGGKLILELPDLIKCCKNIINNKSGKHEDQLGRWGLYGDPREKDKYMCHPWGWAPGELAAFLESHGFRNTQHLKTKFHKCGRDHRDMRIEAIR